VPHVHPELEPSKKGKKKKAKHDDDEDML